MQSFFFSSWAVCLLIAGLALVVGLASYAHAGDAQPYASYVPADKGLDPAWVASLRDRGQQRVYRGEELRLISMPCGGIGAGQLEVTGTGRLGTWWIFNQAPPSNRGRGFTSGAGYMEPLPIEIPVESGFGLRVKTRGWPTQVLHLDERGFDDIRFVGEYPVASFDFKRQRDPLPVSVRANVFSPFVPLSVRDSANPATVLSYTLTNTSDQAVDLDVGGWLENACTSKAPARRRNRVFRTPAVTGVSLGLELAATPDPPAKQEVEVFEDFEAEDLGRRWTADGKAFSRGPLLMHKSPNGGRGGNRRGLGLAGSRRGLWDARFTGTLTSEPFVIERDAIRFRIGGGAFEGQTCLNLMIGDEVVRTATGDDTDTLREVTWDVSDRVGQTARLVLVDQHHEGHLLVDDICFVTPGHDMPFTPVGSGEPAYGDLSISLLDSAATASGGYADAQSFLAAFENGDLAPQDERTFATDEPGLGAVATDFTLQPGESRTVTFLVSWWFPNLKNDPAGGSVGNLYSNWYGGSQDVAEWVAANLPRLEEQTRRFVATYHDTTLPYWLADRVSMPLSTLACENVKIHANGRMYTYEGVSFCHGTCGHVYNFVTTIAQLFPELERSVRLLQDFDERYGFDPSTGRINFRGDEGSNPLRYCNYASDAQSGYILKTYREHLRSPDRSFLETVWPKAKLAMNYQVFRDGAERSLEPNGVLESKQTFWDPMGWGPNPYNNTLYLAALRAAEAMARLMDEPVLADRYHALFESGSAWMQANMWNGDYYVSLYPEGSWSSSWNGVVTVEEEQSNAARYVRAFGSRKNHYHTATACDAQQMFGQNWAHQLDLGYILPPEHCKSAAASVFKHNWTPDIATVYARYAPRHRVLADAAAGEAGMVNGAWPVEERRSFENTHDKDDVWTGLEYQAACDMINEGLLDEALVMIRAIHERYAPTKRNPWNEVEGADHYSRAMQAWNVLLTLGGFTYDGPAGRIGFAPKITPEAFKSFFSAAEGWGSFEQTRGDGGQRSRVILRYGTLTLNAVTLAVADGRAVSSVRVARGDQAVACAWAQRGTEVAVELDAAVELRAGDTLELRLELGLE